MVERHRQECSVAARGASADWAVRAAERRVRGEVATGVATVVVTVGEAMAEAMVEVMAAEAMVEVMVEAMVEVAKVEVAKAEVAMVVEARGAAGAAVRVEGAMVAVMEQGLRGAVVAATAVRAAYRS